MNVLVCLWLNIFVLQAEGEMMKFIWEKYADKYLELIDSCLDSEAVQYTGLDEGWQAFYDYWICENASYENCESFCYVISCDNEPIAVIFIAVEKKFLLFLNL